MPTGGTRGDSLNLAWSPRSPWNLLALLLSVSNSRGDSQLMLGIRAACHHRGRNAVYHQMLLEKEVQQWHLPLHSLPVIPGLGGAHLIPGRPDTRRCGGGLLGLGVRPWLLRHTTRLQCLDSAASPGQLDPSHASLLRTGGTVPTGDLLAAPLVVAGGTVEGALLGGRARVQCGPGGYPHLILQTTPTLST